MEMVRGEYEEDLKYNTGMKGVQKVKHSQRTRTETRCLFLEGRWPAQHRRWKWGWRLDWLVVYFERDFIRIALRLGGKGMDEVKNR